MRDRGLTEFVRAWAWACYLALGITLGLGPDRQATE